MGALIGIGLLGVGFGYAQIRSLAMSPPVLEREIRTEMSGWIENIVPQSENRRRYTIRITNAEQPEFTGLRVRVSAPRAEITLGDAVRVRAVIAPPPASTVHGGYDFARHAYFQGLDGVGYTISSFEPITINGGGISRFVAGLRGSMAERLAATDEKQGGVIAALMVGVRAELRAEFVDALRATGLGHMLAISGLHMAMVAGGAYLLAGLVLASVERLARKRDVRPIAAAIALGVAALYLVMSGASTSTQRAFIMTAVALVSLIFQRRALTLRNVAVAAWAVMVIDPHAPTTAGFQMSFAAATMLVGLVSKLAPPQQSSNKAIQLWYYVRALALTSLFAGLATGPIASFHFQRSAIYGLLANLATMPVFTFIVMPFSVASAMLVPLGMAELPAHIAAMGAGIIESVATTIAQWPMAETPIPAFPVVSLICVMAAIASLCALSRGRLAVLTILALIAMTANATHPSTIAWIGSQGGAIAMDKDGVWTQHQSRADSFGLERTDQRLGQIAGEGRASCIPQGCILSIAHIGSVAVNADPAHYREDCASHDLVVAIGPLPADLREACSKDQLIRLRYYADEVLIITKEGKNWTATILPQRTRRWHGRQSD
jgi:competence protein ComEC